MTPDGTSNATGGARTNAASAPTSAQPGRNLGSATTPVTLTIDQAAGVGAASRNP